MDNCVAMVDGHEQAAHENGIQQAATDNLRLESSANPVADHGCTTSIGWFSLATTEVYGA